MYVVQGCCLSGDSTSNVVIVIVEIYKFVSEVMVVAHLRMRLRKVTKATGHTALECDCVGHAVDSCPHPQLSEPVPCCR